MAYLVDELEELWKLPPNDRGRKFEKLLATLFKQSGFIVHSNPSGARPRQCDLIVEDGEFSILVEAKAQQRRAGSAEIDALRSRLARLPTRIFGAVFCLSDYSAPAIRTVEADKSREILLFSVKEIAALCNGQTNLFRLINQKRRALSVSGSVWFLGSDSDREPHHLPQKLYHFLMGNVSVDVAHCRTNNADVTFALSIPDTAWGGFGGSGVAMRLPLKLNNLSDLRSFFSLLFEYFQPFDRAWFSIHQLTDSWFGFGHEALLSQAAAWKERYERADLQSPHHSEDLSLFADFLDGWIMVSSRQRVSWDRGSHLHHSEVVIQLPGVPIELRAFQRLCRENR